MIWLLDPRGWLALARFWLSARKGEHDRKLTDEWWAWFFRECGASAGFLYTTGGSE